MRGSFTWVIATTNNVVEWYRFDSDDSIKIVATKHSVLDLSFITTFLDKEAAKKFAVSAGLKTWRYVRL